MDLNQKELLQSLRDIAAGRLSPEQALEELVELPYKDLGYAKVDLYREIRNGETEVIYCPGKTVGQTVEIFKKLAEQSANVMATRASLEVGQALTVAVPGLVYDERVRLAYLWRHKTTSVGKVGIVSAGTADIPVAEEAALTAAILGNTVERIYDVGVAGIHRLLDQRKQLMDCRVLVVAAGMEGALASVVGGLVARPVIAVPTSVGYGASFQGVAALLGMLSSCAGGVAVVNIDNGYGAGVLAHRINQLGEAHE